MNYNPLTITLQHLTEQIERLLEHRDDLKGEIDWAASFDTAATTEALDHLRLDRDDRQSRVDEVDARIEELESQMRRQSDKACDLNQRLGAGTGLLRVLSSDYRSLKKSLRQAELKHAGLRHQVRDVQAKRQAAADALAAVVSDISEHETALKRFASFSADAAEDSLEELADQLEQLDERHRELLLRSEEIERAVQPQVSELRAIESHMKTLETNTKRLEHDLDTLNRQMSEAETFRSKLSGADSSYERKLVHDRCERDFGDGNPSAVLRDLRRKRSNARSELDRARSEFDRLDRDHDKLERRITELADVAARNIGHLIIDGNNCCYQGSTLIGLRALIPLTNSVASQYAVTVVFDASIRQRLSVDDDILRSTLPAATVHVTATGTSADGTILDLARDPETWVVSNDRFADFPEKSPVRQRRIIRHEIVRDRVIVRDLGIDEPIAGALGPLG